MSCIFFFIDTSSIKKMSMLYYIIIVHIYFDIAIEHQHNNSNIIKNCIAFNHLLLYFIIIIHIYFFLDPAKSLYCDWKNSFIKWFLLTNRYYIIPIFFANRNDFKWESCFYLHVLELCWFGLFLFLYYTFLIVTCQQLFLKRI